MKRRSRSAEIIPFPDNRIVSRDPTPLEMLQDLVAGIMEGKITPPEKMLCLLVMPPEANMQPIAVVHANVSLLEAKGMLTSVTVDMKVLP